MSKKFNAQEDVEEYMGLIFYMVNKDSRVCTQDKMDVAHDILAKLMGKNKEINRSYIYLTIRSVINDYVSDRSDYFSAKTEMKELFSEPYGEIDFSEFDYHQLPISDKERAKLETYMENTAASISEEENISERTVYRRKKQMIEELKQKLNVPNDL